MDRPRNINLDLLNCPELRGVSLEAELMAHRLPLACDDFGRARLDVDVLRKKLYPRHPEARDAIEHWVREIEKSGFVERYRAGPSDCIRIRRWDKDQAIENPRPSDLPPSPGEKVAPPRPSVETPAANRADATAPTNQSPSMAVDATPPADSVAPVAQSPEYSDDCLDSVLAGLWK